MPERQAPALLAACTADRWAGATVAHDGHGLLAARGQTTDAWGSAFAGELPGVAVWPSTGGKP